MVVEARVAVTARRRTRAFLTVAQQSGCATRNLREICLRYFSPPGEAAAAAIAWLQPLEWEQQELMGAPAAGAAPGDAARPRKKKKLKRGGLNASERRARDDVEGGGD